jgi:hypothetical protein
MRRLAPLSLLLFACTEAGFIDPHAQLRAQTAIQWASLVYSQEEDLTFLEWGMLPEAPLGDLRFEVSLSGGAFAPLDFGQSLYDPMGAICASDDQGRCLRYVWRGEVTAALRVRHPLLSGPPMTVTPALGRLERTLSLSAAFEIGNAAVSVTPQEPGLATRRSFEWTLAPVTSPGECTAEIGIGSAAWRPTSEAAVSIERTPDGFFCVAMRAAGQRDGRGLVLAAAIQTAPELASIDGAFTPPVSLDPLVVQVVDDENVPDSLCADVRAGFREAFDYLGPLAAQAELLPPAIISGADCAMENPQRGLGDPSAMAYDILAATAGTTATDWTALVVYLSNVPVGGPYADLQQVRADLRAQSMRSFVWTVAPVALPIPGGADHTVPWAGGAKDAAQRLGADLQGTFPTRTQEWDPSSPVPLLDDATLQTYAGLSARLCASQPAISVDLSRPLDPASPPTFAVQVSRSHESAGGFVPTTFRYQVEICTRYCDHSAPPRFASAWLDSPGCFQ